MHRSKTGSIRAPASGGVRKIAPSIRDKGPRWVTVCHPSFSCNIQCVCIFVCLRLTAGLRPRVDVLQTIHLCTYLSQPLFVCCIRLSVFVYILSHACKNQFCPHLPYLSSFGDNILNSELPLAPPNAYMQSACMQEILLAPCTSISPNRKTFVTFISEWAHQATSAPNT